MRDQIQFSNLVILISNIHLGCSYFYWFILFTHFENQTAEIINDKLVPLAKEASDKILVLPAVSLNLRRASCTLRLAGVQRRRKEGKRILINHPSVPGRERPPSRSYHASPPAWRRRNRGVSCGHIPALCGWSRMRIIIRNVNFLLLPTLYISWEGYREKQREWLDINTPCGFRPIEHWWKSTSLRK